MSDLQLTSDGKLNLTRSQLDNSVGALHSSAVTDLSIDVDDSTRQLSEYPWTAINNNVTFLSTKEARLGRAYILFPLGLSWKKTDLYEQFNQDNPLDTVPGLVGKLLEGFQLQPRFVQHAEQVLDRVRRKVRKKNRKKKGDLEKLVLVGIHSR